jgi:hypothetical protein
MTKRVAYDSCEMVVWHADADDGPHAGNCLASFKLTGNADLSNSDHDFEDISIGPGPDPSMDYLYLGAHRPPLASFVGSMTRPKFEYRLPSAAMLNSMLSTETRRVAADKR